jgi:hypothetical protein
MEKENRIENHGGRAAKGKRPASETFCGGPRGKAEPASAGRNSSGKSGRHILQEGKRTAVKLGVERLNRGPSATARTKKIALPSEAIF